MVTDEADRTRDSQRPPDDVLADLLEDPRLYHVVSVLAERSDPVALTDLAAAVRGRETGTDPRSIDADERRRVRRDLFEERLPKLTATEVVAYDSLLATVELTDSERAREALAGA